MASDFAALVSQLADHLLALSRQHVPVDTGALQDSLNVHTTMGSDSATLELFGLDYGKFVIAGTAPHDIYPVNAQALYWPGAAHPVAHVSHPGTRANDFRQAIIAAMRPLMEAAGQQALQAQAANIRRSVAAT